MSKLLKWLIGLAAVMVILFVLVVFVLPKVVDPNNYKEQIRAAVLEKTGRELTIDGDIKWSVFPTVGLDLSDVSLGDTDGSGEQPMLKIGEAGITVKLKPLLNRRIEINEVKLADVSVNLPRKADGADFSVSPAGGDTVVVAGIEISNANITLNNTEQITELSKSGLKESGVELGQSLNLKGGFSVRLPPQNVAGDVLFSGLFRISSDGNRFGIQGLKLSFKGRQGSAGEALNLDMNVNTNADVDLEQDKATLSGMVLKLYGLSASGDLKVESLSSDPVFKGQLTLAEFSPKSLMQSMGMEAPLTSNSQALTRLQADMRFTGSANGANMENLTARLDQSTITGKLKIDGFDKPRLAFDVLVDRLNLDDYKTAEGSSTGGSQSAEADVSSDVFRSFTGGGNMRVGQLQVAGLTATNASLGINGNGSIVTISPIKAQFYGGQHEGDIRIDASGSRPLLSASHGLTGINVGGMLEDLAGASRLQGVGDLFLQINTDLSNSQSFLRSLSGDIGMSILNGEIVGVDVIETIAMVKAALGKQSEVTGESGQDQVTEFAELTMTGVFDQGTLTSEDLLMQSPLLRATGEGSFNLVDESVDYLLSPVLLGDLDALGLAELSGIAIPVRLTGNLYEPDIKVDIVAAITASQADKIEQKANELVGKLLGGKSSNKKDKKE